jgi:hypothetical protein
MKSQFCNKIRGIKRQKFSFCGRHNKKFKKIFFLSFFLPISFCPDKYKKKRRIEEKGEVEERDYILQALLYCFFSPLVYNFPGLHKHCVWRQKLYSV